MPVPERSLGLRPGRVAVVLLVLWVLVAAFRFAVDWVGYETASWSDYAIEGGVVAVLVTAALAVVAWWAPGTSRGVGVREAVERGELPADASPDTWVPALARAERSAARMRWVGGVVMAGFTGLSGWLAVTDGARYWLLAAVFPTAFLGALVADRRRTAVLVRLREQLERRGATP
jgi:hypothetical protein